MDEVAFPGCVLDARVVGVSREKLSLDVGRTQRNDRVLFVAAVSHTFNNVQTMEDLPRQIVDRMQEFFVAYPRLLAGKSYRLVATKGPEDAIGLIG